LALLKFQPWYQHTVLPDGGKFLPKYVGAVSLYLCVLDEVNLVGIINEYTDPKGTD